MSEMQGQPSTDATPKEQGRYRAVRATHFALYDGHPLLGFGQEPQWPHGRHCTIPRCPHCGGCESWDR